MANNVFRIKRSSVSGRIPKGEDLEVGELAVNLADLKLFTKDTANSVQTLIGTTGDKGQKGELGDKGTKGDTGTIGLPGIAGDKGDTGAKGDTGSNGSKGDKGVTGSKGEQGAFGGAAFEFTYLDSTANTEPGDGYLKFSNTYLTAASYLLIDNKMVTKLTPQAT